MVDLLVASLVAKTVAMRAVLRAPYSVERLADLWGWWVAMTVDLKAAWLVGLLVVSMAVLMVDLLVLKDDKSAESKAVT